MASPATRRMTISSSRAPQRLGHRDAVGPGGAQHRPLALARLGVLAALGVAPQHERHPLAAGQHGVEAPELARGAAGQRRQRPRCGLPRPGGRRPAPPSAPSRRSCPLDLAHSAAQRAAAQPVPGGVRARAHARVLTLRGTPVDEAARPAHRAPGYLPDVGQPEHDAHGIAVFTGASALSGLAPTPAVLIAARVLQGAGAALMFPQTLTGIQLAFTGPARVRAIGLYAIALSAGAVAGQLLGGALISADLLGSGWRAIFLVNVPIGLVALVAGARRLPADDDRASRRIDLRGVAALSVTVLLVVLPLVLGRADGWPAWTWICFPASVPALALFVATQRGRAEPLLNLHALAPRPVAFGLAAVAAATATPYYALLFTLALYLQQGLGREPARLRPDAGLVGRRLRPGRADRAPRAGAPARRCTWPWPATARPPRSRSSPPDWPPCRCSRSRPRAWQRVARRALGCRHGPATPRPPDRDRCLVPGPGARVVAHARGRARRLRGAGAGLRGPARPHPLAPAPGAALPAEARLPADRDGHAAVDRRPELQPRVPHPPHRAARPGLRGAAPAPHGADLLPAPGPLQAAVGAVADRGPRGRELRAHLQDASLDGGRGVRCRPRNRPVRSLPGAAAGRARQRRLGPAPRAQRRRARGRRRARHRALGLQAGRRRAELGAPSRADDRQRPRGSRGRGRDRVGRASTRRPRTR